LVATSVSPKRARGIILKECERAIAEDKSGAIVLGCAGMADLGRFLEQHLQVPVIDGVAAAVKFAEALVGLGLNNKRVIEAYLGSEDESIGSRA
jgi:allantoin racemase